MVNTPSIGERLAAARKQREWSQVVLADKSGISQSMISQIEGGERRNPGVLTLTALEQALALEHGCLSRPDEPKRRRRDREAV